MPQIICVSPLVKLYAAFISLIITQMVTTIVFEPHQHGNENNLNLVSTSFSIELLKLLTSFVFIIINTQYEGNLIKNSKTAMRCINTSVHATIEKLHKQVGWRLTLNSAAVALLCYGNLRLLLSVNKSVDHATVSLLIRLLTPLYLILLRMSHIRPLHYLSSMAILMQVVGLIVLQYDPDVHSTAISQLQYAMLLCVTVMNTICGVWNEWCLKHLNADLLVQNIVLYSFGVIFHFLGLCLTAYRSLSTLNPFSLPTDHSRWTISNIICQSFAGLAVSVVYKYGDIIMQTWASACTIAASFLINMLFFWVTTDVQTCSGATIVFFACFIYIRTEKIGILSRADVSNRNPIINQSAPVTNAPNSRSRRSIATKAFLSVSLALIGYFISQQISSPLSPRVTQSWLWRNHQLPRGFFEITKVDPLQLNRPITLHGSFNTPGLEFQLTVNSVNCSIYHVTPNEVVCNAPELLDRLSLNETVMLIFKIRYAKRWAVQNVKVHRLMTHWERHRILLLICFGQPRYERMAFLSMFEDLFPKVVYAGNTSGENILVCPELPWHNHVCIARAIEKYPNYAGYLYQTFDVAVVLNNLVEFNTSQIWRAKDFLSRHSPFGVPVHESTASGWMWSAYRVLANTKQAFAMIDHEIQSNGTNAKRYRKYMQNLVVNAGSPDMRLGSFSDVYYIPNRLASDWLFLAGTAGVFAKCNVIHEIVSPTLSWMITDGVTTTYEQLEGEYLTETPVADFLRNPQWHYFHRINLADRNHRDFIRTIKTRSHVYV